MATTGLLIAASRSALADPPTANDPVAIINAIYARVAKGKGDGGGTFIIETGAAKAKYLSKSLTELWTRADARAPKGDVGPVDFVDPGADDDALDLQRALEFHVRGAHDPAETGADEFVHGVAVAALHLVVARGEDVIEVAAAVDMLVHVDVVRTREELGFEAGAAEGHGV